MSEFGKVAKSIFLGSIWGSVKKCKLNIIFTKIINLYILSKISKGGGDVPKRIFKKNTVFQVELKAFDDSNLVYKGRIRSRLSLRK
jgi:hypothetical protein